VTLLRLKPTLLTDQVYDVLHHAIVNGELPAGSRLRIRDLAEQVGTSVMPVREAIRRLEQAGLAEREPHKGAVVKGLTLAELVHVYGVRRLLEGEAARLGSERITAEDCERLHAEYDLMVGAVGDGRVVDYLDHKMINDLPPFTELNPSAENLARYFFQETSRTLSEKTGGRVQVKDCTIFETDSSFARYYE